jgi:2-C-methyl-D-erythritol 4-phosphate cytidylyltransferase
MKEYALIVAGGSGTRMGNPMPKQFLPLLDKPILMHTVLAFYNYSHAINIIVVLPERATETWKKLLTKYNFEIPHTIVPGGDSRFHSVKNGLHHIADPDAIVAIHDGVRPLVSSETIGLCMREAAATGTGVAVVPLKESIRKVENDISVAIDRTDYVLVQTPQTFRLSLIKKAYDIPDSPELTDDATVVERSGMVINLVEGDYSNIKITTPEDLVYAEELLKIRNKKAGP